MRSRGFGWLVLGASLWAWQGCGGKSIDRDSDGDAGERDDKPPRATGGSSNGTGAVATGAGATGGTSTAGMPGNGASAAIGGSGASGGLSANGGALGGGAAGGRDPGDCRGGDCFGGRGGRPNAAGGAGMPSFGGVAGAAGSSSLGGGGQSAGYAGGALAGSAGVGGVNGGGVNGGGVSGLGAAGEDAAGASGAGGALDESVVTCDREDGEAVGTPYPNCEPLDITNPCELCLQARCCEEIKGCWRYEPYDQCGWGGPIGSGEFNCYVDCFADNECNVTPDACAYACMTPACPTFGQRTIDITMCAQTRCPSECFPSCE